MKLLKASEMAFADENTIKLTGIPSLVLMENAGRTAAQIILEKKDFNSAVVIAGSGNNGGDGLVIARYLLLAGKDVKVFILSDTTKKLSEDNRKNLEIFETFGGQVSLIGKDKLGKLRNAIKSADIVVDAIFGTGFKPPVKGYREKAIEIINNYARYVVAVDIPSGLSTDTGNIEGVHTKADITITFAYPKVAHVLYPASEFCGDVYVVDISIDHQYLKEVHRYLLEPVELVLPERKKNSHKYTYGHLLVIGGSKGKTGAPIMAAKSATAAGSGLVSVVVPEELDTIFETALIEEMSIPVDSRDGTFGKKAADQIKQIIKNGKFTSIAIGMGMSVNQYTMQVVERILKEKMPVVIDADGLNNLAIIDGFKNLLQKRKYPTVLTPHIGEMSRLTGISTKEILDNMEDVVREFSTETKTYVVLKGSRTVISTPEGKVYYSIRGNEGMATAGTGDVLAGILGTMVYRLGAEEGAKTGVYLHGLSGDIAAQYINKESMKATDLIKFIPDALDLLQNYQEKYTFYKHIDPLKEIL
ncbi:bifunctional ADP-dependent NAD(P)H-hydrate dehydratase/NAD(P)H-hydrate epimerase [Persephonella sp. KM09-Lau-8]|uniref:bifunctional ADP-dependent NAD(P)H-hydrate dehydratase/NAD(P)H-hydrate epimerase n=1 Tax=Persephonella sp. KM09-Lau-8 TaxID=1158345 RepID=UPI000496FFD9|nr:bifunctional ADP-dependent NAD(P)H-hydrate dehydratase/NAD(P)H-hydrate epimerase [Persephonella sp. KM09-Lau-8]